MTQSDPLLEIIPISEKARCASEAVKWSLAQPDHEYLEKSALEQGRYIHLALEAQVRHTLRQVAKWLRDYKLGNSPTRRSQKLALLAVSVELESLAQQPEGGTHDAE